MSAPDPTRELTAALRRFAARTECAALDLYTNIHACVFLPGVPEAQCAVAQNLFALGGIAEMLNGSISFSIPSAKLSPQEVETLERCMALCKPVLDAVDEGVKVADNYVNPNSTLRLEKGTHRLGAFPAGAVDEQRIVQTCLHEFVRMEMKVRSQVLEQKAELVDDEVGQSLRLKEALKHADLNKSITAMSVGRETHFIPQVLEASFPKSIIQVDAIPPQPYQRTEYIQSLSYDFSAATANQWSPKNVMGEASKSAEEANSAKAKKDAHPTPASTRESTPALDGSFVHVSASTEGAQQARNTSGPSTGKGKARADNTTEETETTSVPPVTNTNNTSTSQPHPLFTTTLFERLEFYIMHPHADSFVDSVTWTSKIELLHLHQSAQQSHLQQSGPNSVVAELSKLSPHQIRIIQARTKSRQGHLVSVQQGRLVDVVTPMGTFQAKQVIFGLLTRQPPEVEDSAPLGGFGTAFSGLRPSQSTGFGGFGNPSSGFGQSQSNSLFGQSQSRPFGGFGSGFGQPQSNNLFGQNNTSNPIQTNGPAQENRFSLPTRGLFGPPPAPADRTFFLTPKDYENYLGDQGEECFLVEEDPSSRPNGLLQYMTITTGNRYANSGQDHSLEEMRAEDYAAGREGPTKVNPFLYSWENPIRTEPVRDDEKPFGGQYTNPEPRKNLSGNPASSVLNQSEQQASWKQLFDRRAAANPQQSTSGGLFGNLGSTSQTQPTSTGLFGNLTPPSQQQSASGGLFGNLGFSSQQQPPPAGGLFGNLASSTQQRPSGGIFGNAAWLSQQQSRPPESLFGKPASPKPQQQQPSSGPAERAKSSSPKPEQKQPSGGLFGNRAPSSAQSAQTSGSLFEKPTTSSSQQEQKKPLGGLFAKAASPSPQQQPQQPSSSSSGSAASSIPKPSPAEELFGKAASSPKPEQKQPSGGPSNRFGSSTWQPPKSASPNPQQEQKSSSSNFFTKSAPSSQPQQPAPQSSGGLFGKTPASPSMQSQPQQAGSSGGGGGLFGNGKKYSLNKPAGNLFGTFGPHADSPPRSTSFFGTHPPPPSGILFGQPTSPEHFRTSLHSVPPTSSTSSPSLFGKGKDVDTETKTNKGKDKEKSKGKGKQKARAESAANSSGTWHCKVCNTSLVFHPAAEQFAALCDVCKGDKNTSCWLCERKMKAEEGEGAQGSAAGEGKGKEKAKEEDDDDDDEDEEEEDDEEEDNDNDNDNDSEVEEEEGSSTPQPQPQSHFAFAEYKNDGARVVSPFASLSGQRMSPAAAFSFGPSASVKKEGVETKKKD